MHPKCSIFIFRLCFRGFHFFLPLIYFPLHGHFSFYLFCGVWDRVDSSGIILKCSECWNISFNRLFVLNIHIYVYWFEKVIKTMLWKKGFVYVRSLIIYILLKAAKFVWFDIFYFLCLFLNCLFVCVVCVYFYFKCLQICVMLPQMGNSSNLLSSYSTLRVWMRSQLTDTVVLILQNVYVGFRILNK